MRSEAFTQQDRQIRVFISSTFRDMKAERDYLVKFTFPQLRRLCESRGVAWGEVDLRWGVTDEEAAEGKVLPICLEEIERCRPYFIGLLGERYGWVPDSIPQELLDREEWLQEQLAGHKSVTELEILHGILLNKNMAGHAFFYFRDPAYVPSVPEAERNDFAAENAESAGKLWALKNNIRASGFPVREGYRNPKVLGRAIRRDLGRVINQLWPEGSQPNELERERLDHEAYARSRAHVYIGRYEYFQKLDQHADGKGDQPLVILGESGSGKSALLANWALHYRKEHPDVLIIQHFIGASPQSADWTAMLRRILGEFKERMGVDAEIPGDPQKLREAFPNWLHMAAARGRAVLILDALNQLEDSDGAPELVWLPPVMPDKVRLLVSTLPGRPLEETRRRQWPEMRVQALNEVERAELIEKYLGDRSKKLNDARRARIAAAPQSANPLYLRVLLDELCVTAEHEKLDERIEHYLSAPTPVELYEKVIARWEADYEGGTDLVGDALSLLWASRRGLSEAELLEALGDANGPLPRARWSPLFLAISNALVSRSGLLNFAHDFLRKAVQQSYLSSEENCRKAHLLLANYFELRVTASRRIDELPWQLAEAKEWKRLQYLLVDLRFFADAWRRNPSEVRKYWAQVEASSTLRMLEAYGPIIEHPETEVDTERLWSLGLLLAEMGHPRESSKLQSFVASNARSCGDYIKLIKALNALALALLEQGEVETANVLLEEAESICRETNNIVALSRTVGHKAMILQRHGDIAQAMGIFEEQEAIFRKLGDLAGLASALGNKGSILHLRGDLNGAMALWGEQEQIYRQLGDLGGLQIAVCNRGAIFARHGDWDRAEALYKEAEKVSRQLGDPNGLSAALGNRAGVLYWRGNIDGAMALEKESETVSRQAGNLKGVANSLANQAIFLKARGDLEKALALLKAAEEIYRQLGDLQGTGSVIGNCGNIFYSRGDLDSAMALWVEQEEIYRKLGYLQGIGHALANQALISQRRGDSDGALALYEESESIFRQLGDSQELQAMLGKKAEVFYRCGNLEKAMALHKDAELICRKYGYLDGLQRSLGDQGIILRDRGDTDGAMALLKEQEQICRQIGHLNSLAASLTNQGTVLQSRGDLDSSLKLLKEAERICRQLGNLNALATSLGAQGLVLRSRRDLDGALTLLEESERIVRTLGNVHDLASILANKASVLGEAGRASDGVPLMEEALRLATNHNYVALANRMAPVLNALRQAAKSPAPAPIAVTPPRKLPVAELRALAANALKRENWETASTFLEKLLQNGEPVENVGPDLITALLNAHETIAPSTITRVESILAQVESAGHAALAASLREKLAAKLPVKKRSWKFW